MKFLCKINLLIVLLALSNFSFANSMACGAYLCLSQDQGEYPEDECSSYREAFFNIRLYTPYYNDAATYAARMVYMLTCPLVPSPGTNDATQLLMQIMMEFGYEENDPHGTA